jgi:hypothetical protein
MFLKWGMYPRQYWHILVFIIGNMRIRRKPSILKKAPYLEINTNGVFLNWGTQWNQMRRRKMIQHFPKLLRKHPNGIALK